MGTRLYKKNWEMNRNLGLVSLEILDPSIQKKNMPPNSIELIECCLYPEIH